MTKNTARALTAAATAAIVIIAHPPFLRPAFAMEFSCDFDGVPLLPPQRKGPRLAGHCP